MDDEVVSGRLERPVHPQQQGLEQPGKVFVLLMWRLLEPRAVPAWQQPGLERKPRGVRRQRDNLRALQDHTPAGRDLLPDDVAEDAALFRRVMASRALDLLAHEVGDDRQRDELRMRVLERRARRSTMVLEDQDVPKPTVLLEIHDTIAE